MKYTKVAVAQRLAQVGASDPPDLPSIGSARIVERIKFIDSGRTGASMNPIREIHSGQGMLTEDLDGRGYWIDGKVLVPWSNVRWVEYR